MTRQEFLDEITSWEDLLEFCRDYGYESYTKDIYDSYTIRDEFIDEDIRDVLDYESQYTLRDRLDDVDLSGNYYEYRGRLEYYCVDDDFDCYFDDVLGACDRDLFFDEEDDEEDDEEEQENVFDPVTGELLETPVCRDPNVLYRQGFNRPCASAITVGLSVHIGLAERCEEREAPSISIEQMFS